MEATAGKAGGRKGVTAVEFILMAGIGVFLAVLIVNFAVTNIFNPTLNASNGTVSGVNDRSSCFFVDCADTCDESNPNLRLHSAVCENGQCIYRGSQDCGADGCFNGECVQAAPKVGFNYAPLMPLTSHNVRFTSTASGGTIVQYYWSFGDGNFTSTTAAVIEHRYAAAGTYNVTHSVTGNSGKQNSTTKEIPVT